MKLFLLCLFTVALSSTVEAQLTSNAPSEVQVINMPLGNRDIGQKFKRFGGFKERRRNRKERRRNRRAAKNAKKNMNEVGKMYLKTMTAVPNTSAPAASKNKPALEEHRTDQTNDQGAHSDESLSQNSHNEQSHDGQNQDEESHE